MIPSNPVPQVCNYGTSATYRDLPNEEQLRNGVVPLDSLPAAWWNCMWNMTNGAINCARYAAGVLIDEINTVLTRAGVCVNCGCVDQLYQAIDKIRQTIGTASIAGAVKSSSTASEVAIDPTTGIMSVNCLGNAASLTTTASTVVGAINELKSTYDTCWSDNATALNGKAPTNHASSANTYGVGSATNYGHLKISDVYNNSNCQGTDIAASQKAVYCAWKVASDAAAGNISLGNTAGCALGTAAAGTATTAARSDHVHPIPTSVPYAVTGGYLGERAALGCAPNCTYGIANIWNYCNDNRYYLIGTKYDNTACKYNVRVDYATSATNATNATNACKAACNSSGTAFGTAAVCATKTLTAKGDSGYNGSCAACQNLLVTTGFMSYWNGAYSGSYSNLTYFCGGAFGSAAACAATDFRANNWWPDSLTSGCVCCATRATCATRFGTCYSSATQCTWLCWCYCCTSGSCKFGRVYIYNCANDLVYTMLDTTCMTTIPDQILYQYGIRVGVPIQIAAKTCLQLKTIAGCILFSCCTFPSSNQKYYLDSRSVLTAY